MKKATVMDVDDPLNERPALPPMKSIVGRQQDDNKDKTATPRSGDTGGTGNIRKTQKGGNAKPSKIKNIKVSWTWFTVQWPTGGGIVALAGIGIGTV